MWANTAGHRVAKTFFVLSSKPDSRPARNAPEHAPDDSQPKIISNICNDRPAPASTQPDALDVCEIAIRAPRKPERTRTVMVSQPATLRTARIPVAALGWSLGLFLAITFTICVVFDLIFPSVAMNRVWLPLLPWVNWITLPSFLLGLAEIFLYGWFVALIFAPLFNHFARRSV
jgi:uncharacterized protein DUF5676